MTFGYLCASHDVCPEFREYERSSTTLINAYVGPLMDKYLGELERGSRHRIAIMQSNGGFMSTKEARRMPFAPCSRDPPAAWWARSK